MAGFNRIQLLLLHSLALWCTVNAGGLHPHTEGFSHQIHHPDGSTHHSTFIKHNTDIVPRNHESSVYDHGSGHVVSVHSTGPHGFDQHPGYRSHVVASRPAGGALFAAGGPAYAGFVAQPAVTQVVAQPAVTQVVAQPAVTQVVSRPVVSQVVAPATTTVVSHGGFGAVYPGGYGYGGFGYGGYGGLRYGGAAYGAGLGYGGGLGYGVGLGYGGLGYGGGYGYSRTSFRRGPYIGNRRLPTAFGEVHVPHHEYHHHEHDTVHPPTYGAYGARFLYQQPAVSVVQAPAVQVAAPVVQPASTVYSTRFAVHAAPAAAVVHAAPAAAVVHAAPAAVVHAGGEVHHKLVGPDGTILGRLKK